MLNDVLFFDGAITVLWVMLLLLFVDYVMFFLRVLRGTVRRYPFGLLIVLGSMFISIFIDEVMLTLSFFLVLECIYLVSTRCFGRRIPDSVRKEKECWSIFSIIICFFVVIYIAIAGVFTYYSPEFYISLVGLLILMGCDFYWREKCYLTD